MKKLVTLRNKIKRLNINKLLFNILEDSGLQAKIVELNTESQLYGQGIDADGNSLAPYAPITVSFYKPLAASEGRDGRTDHTTLKDTGQYYESHRVKNMKDGFIIESDSIMEDGTDLAREYGKKIVGLTQESINEIIPEIRESLRMAIRKAIVG